MALANNTLRPAPAPVSSESRMWLTRRPGNSLRTLSITFAFLRQNSAGESSPTSTSANNSCSLRCCRPTLIRRRSKSLGRARVLMRIDTSPVTIFPVLNRCDPASAHTGSGEGGCVGSHKMFGRGIALGTEEFGRNICSKVQETSERFPSINQIYPDLFAERTALSCS
jgi:hypothetical protein